VREAYASGRGESETENGKRWKGGTYTKKRAHVPSELEKRTALRKRGKRAAKAARKEERGKGGKEKRKEGEWT